MGWMQAVAGGAALLFRWWLTGLFWTGRAADRDLGLDLEIRRICRGFLLNTLLTVALAFAGVFRPGMEWLGTAVLAALGALAGLRRAGARGGVRLPAAIPVLAVWAALLAMPGRGEWMAGGWDPGVYLQQGVAHSREGRWRPAPDPVWAQLEPEELPAFTRVVFGHFEAYPGVPVHPERRSLEPWFFPLTPAVIAQLHRAGGLRAAFRVNDLLGWLGALALAAAAWRLTRRPAAGVAAGVILLTSPVWTYHMHLPTSEIAQVLLLAGLAREWAEPAQGRAARWWIGGYLLAAGLNRFSFLPFGALILLLDAMRRPAARRRPLWGLALVASAALNAWAVPLTLVRLGASIPLLLWVAAAGFALTIAVSALFRRRPAWRRAAARIPAWGLPLAAAAAFAGFGAMDLASARLPGVLRFPAWNVRLLRDVAGILLPVAGVAGLLGGLGDRSAKRRAWRGWMLFLLASAAGTLLIPQIGRLAPWALRRQVEFALPLLALGAAAGFAWTVRPGARAVARRAAAGLLLAVLLGAQGPPAWRAWRATEYDGFDAVCREIAARIGPDDIVVADHFKWAAPLRRVYGRDVLNGEVWWETPRPEDFGRAVRRLDALARARGGRLLFLTSTEQGLGVFPGDLRRATPAWESEPWPTREVVHSARGRSIRTRDRQWTFRLHALAGPSLPFGEERPVPRPPEPPSAAPRPDAPAGPDAPSGVPAPPEGIPAAEARSRGEWFHRLESPGIPVRERIEELEALGRRGDPFALGILMEFGRRDVYLNHAAVDALRHASGPEVSDYLAGMIEHPDSQVVCAAVRSLAEVEGERAIAAIVRTLRANRFRPDGHHDDVSAACVEALGRIRSPAAIPALRDELEETVGVTLGHEYGSRIVEALGRIGDASAAPVLRAYRDRLAATRAAMPQDAMGRVYLESKIREVEEALRSWSEP